MLNFSNRFQKSMEQFEWQILCEKAEHLKSAWRFDMHLSGYTIQLCPQARHLSQKHVLRIITFWIIFTFGRLVQVAWSIYLSVKSGKVWITFEFVKSLCPQIDMTLAEILIISNRGLLLFNFSQFVCLYNQLYIVHWFCVQMAGVL